MVDQLEDYEQMEFDELICPLAPCVYCYDFHCEHHPENNPSKEDKE